MGVDRLGVGVGVYVAPVLTAHTDVAVVLAEVDSLGLSGQARVFLSDQSWLVETDTDGECALLHITYEPTVDHTHTHTLTPHHEWSTTVDQNATSEADSHTEVRTDVDDECVFVPAVTHSANTTHTHASVLLSRGAGAGTVAETAYNTTQLLHGVSSRQVAMTARVLEDDVDERIHSMLTTHSKHTPTTLRTKTTTTITTATPTKTMTVIPTPATSFLACNGTHVGDRHSDDYIDIYCQRVKGRYSALRQEQPTPRMKTHPNAPSTVANRKGMLVRDSEDQHHMNEASAELLYSTYMSAMNTTFQSHQVVSVCSVQQPKAYMTDQPRPQRRLSTTTTAHMNMSGLTPTRHTVGVGVGVMGAPVQLVRTHDTPHTHAHTHAHALMGSSHPHARHMTSGSVDTQELHDMFDSVMQQQQLQDALLAQQPTDDHSRDKLRQKQQVRYLFDSLFHHIIITIIIIILHLHFWIGIFVVKSVHVPHHQLTLCFLCIVYSFIATLSILTSHHMYHYICTAIYTHIYPIYIYI